MMLFSWRLCLGHYKWIFEFTKYLLYLLFYLKIPISHSVRNKILSDPALFHIRKQINNSHIKVAISGFRLVICTGIHIVMNVVEVTFEFCPRAYELDRRFQVAQLLKWWALLAQQNKKLKEHNLPTLIYWLIFYILDTNTM